MEGPIAEARLVDDAVTVTGFVLWLFPKLAATPVTEPNPLPFVAMAVEPFQEPPMGAPPKPKLSSSPVAGIGAG